MKTQNIPLGMGESSEGVPVITIKEASNATQVEYWPKVSIMDSNRRQLIFEAVERILTQALSKDVKNIGFFTMGLEVSHVPSWEIAEEIVRVIHKHSKLDSTIDKVLLVAASPTQVSSFQYTLQNISVVARE